MDKNSECEEAVLNLIKGNPLGYCQNALWKELDIDSRKCSRIVKKLLDAGLITRENTVVSGSRTYLLKAVGVEKQNNYELLVAGEV
ncbi:MAG: winged helix-turn-helix transcriptional regulator, partial [Methanosarcinaceae archaeon]|nr:winged helix-turn-helix transcriptional regulator [Methanosarcinaceae archaeon]